MTYGKDSSTSVELSQATHRYDKTDLDKKIDRIDSLYGDLIRQYCQEIPARLVMARIQVESGGRPRTTARAQKWQTGYGSELGLLQLSPDTRHQYKITEEQAYDPETNIRIGCDLWTKWVAKFFTEVPLPEKDDRTKAVWAWLITAIGPGALRRLRKLAKNSYDLDILQSIVQDQELMQKNKGFWGSQSPSLVAWRVGTAIAIVNACKFPEPQLTDPITESLGEK